jgi:hypothetical protein
MMMKMAMGMGTFCEAILFDAVENGQRNASAKEEAKKGGHAEHNIGGEGAPSLFPLVAHVKVHVPVGTKIIPPPIIGGRCEKVIRLKYL